MKPVVQAMSSDPEIDRLAHVRPASWENPPPRPRYDLVVLGGGSAGTAAALAAAERGAVVALVERHHLGGYARNVGPLALRALRVAADAVADRSDFASIQQRMREARANLAPRVGARRLTDHGIDVFFGDARFGGPKTVEVAGTWLTFEHALVATGSRCAVPRLEGLDAVPVLLADSIAELRRVPERVVLLAGDPMAVELAQVLRRLGAEVSLVAPLERLVEHAGVDEALRQALAHDGVELHLGVRVERVERVGEDVRAHLEGGDVIEGDRLVLATGWTPAREGLNLRAAGIETFSVDARLRTSAKNVWAAGSVLSGVRNLQTSDAMGRLVVENALGGAKREVSSLLEVRVSGTTPEVAEVGPSASAREALRLRVETLRTEVGAVERGVVHGAVGFAEVQLEQGTDRVVAATVVCDEATEVLTPLLVAVQQGVGLEAFLSMELPAVSRALVWKRLAVMRARARPAALGGRLRALIGRK